MQTRPVLKHKESAILTPEERWHDFVQRGSERAKKREEAFQSLKALYEEYREERLRYDARVFTELRDQLELFKGLVEVGGNLEPVERAKEQALFQFRQRMVEALENSFATVTDQKFRQDFLIAGQNVVPSGQIVNAIGPELFYSIWAKLSEETRRNLFAQLQNSPHRDQNDTALALFKHCQAFPHIEDLPIDLYKKDHLQLFYGHLIATFARLGERFYREFTEEARRANKKLEALQPRQYAFPNKKAFGSLSEGLYVYLIRQYMRDLIAQPDQPPAAYKLLNYYDNFGQGSQTAAVTKFNATPARSSFHDAFRGAFNLPNRRGILAEVQQALPGEKPFAGIYKLLCNLQHLDDATRDKTADRTSDVVTLLVTEMEVAMYRYEERKNLDGFDPNQAFLHLNNSLAYLTKITELGLSKDA